MPMPPPISSHRDLCLGVASRSRGNQARGADISRPSASATFSASRVQETFTAETSLRSAKVLMPRLQKIISVFNHDLPNLRQLVTAEPIIAGQAHGVEPKLRVSPRMSHVYVRWLAALHTEEEEPVTA